MAIRDSGYIAPEDGQPGIEKTKSDVYAFGVLLLELLTGRRPLDMYVWWWSSHCIRFRLRFLRACVDLFCASHHSSTPREENSLVRWASSRLHDLQYLELMVDLGIRGTIKSRALSRVADIISRCLQVLSSSRFKLRDILQFCQGNPNIGFS